MGRQKILDSALRLFGERGYEGTTLKDIGTAAGMKAPSIYAHFPSKEAVFQAVYETVYQEHSEHFAQLTRDIAELPPLERIRALLAEIGVFYRLRPGLASFHLRTSALLGSGHFVELVEDFQANEAVLTTAIRAAFEDGLADGTFNGGTAEGFVELVLCLMDGLFLQLAHYSPEQSASRFDVLWAQLASTLVENRTPTP